MQIKKIEPIDKDSAAGALPAGRWLATLGAKNGNNKKFLFKKPFFCDQSAPTARGTARTAGKVAATREAAPMHERTGKTSYAMGLNPQLIARGRIRVRTEPKYWICACVHVYFPKDYEIASLVDNFLGQVGNGDLCIVNCCVV